MCLEVQKHLSQKVFGFWVKGALEKCPVGHKKGKKSFIVSKESQWKQNDPLQLSPCSANEPLTKGNQCAGPKFGNIWVQKVVS